MLTSAFDIFLNLVLPILGLIAIGFYVYKSKNWVAGIFLTWAFTVVLELISFLGGLLLSFSVSPRSAVEFTQGRGVVAALILGWIYGVVVSLIAIGIRFLLDWVRSTRRQTR